MTPLFISDLHLDDARPEVTEAFLALLDGPARESDTLYILGDLFDSWIGDDAIDAHDQRVAQGLQRYTEAGHRCRFLHGNRDFLIGTRFAAMAGIDLMPGPQLIDLAGERALVMHGDELCIDDHGYQRLRRVVRNRAVQWTFLHLPRSLRQRIAGGLRAGSTASQEQKLPEIMDVNQNAVVQTMSHFGVTLLIHGHTHRPAIHEFELGNVRARRIVLGDWYTQGSMLSWSGAGPQLLSLDYA